MDAMDLVHRSVWGLGQVPNSQIEAGMKSQEQIHLGDHGVHFVVEQKEYPVRVKATMETLRARYSRAD